MRTAPEYATISIVVISRTPYRISFFGGGSDFPEHFRKHGGQVLSMAIDKYSYVMVRKVPPLGKTKYRIRYSQIENVEEINDIKHPSVRACFRDLGWDMPCTLTHDGDLPARSGIGSSSAFTVGLLNTLYGIRETPVGPQELAGRAIRIERELIGETVGCQDQTAAAYGGLNVIKFRENGRIELEGILLRNQSFFDNILLLFTGFTRIAQTIEKDKLRRNSTSALCELASMVPSARYCLMQEDYESLGKYLNDAWLIKKKLSPLVSNDAIDGIIATALNNGAWGAKLCGAGGGGFLMLLTPPSAHSRLIKVFPKFEPIRVGLDHEGSHIIYAAS